MSLAPTAMRRLMRELATFRTSPPDGLRVRSSDEDILDIIGIIAGPEGTPYEGGFFNVKFQFTEEFPNVPPKCTMLTKIFHPNVSKAGEICVNTLKKDWKREYGIQHILVTIRCLLIYPNAESALDESAGKLLLENYDEFSKHARIITSVHATPRVSPPEFKIRSAPQPSPSSSASTSSFRPPQEGSSSSSRAHTNSNGLDSSLPPTKPLSKSSTGGVLAVVETAEPLQLSPANNSSLEPQHSSPTPSSSLSKENSTAPTKENGPNGISLAAGKTAVKRPTGAASGVAKRKKGLKRL